MTREGCKLPFFSVPPPFYVGDSQFIDLYQLCHSMAGSRVVTRIDDLLSSSVVCWVNIPPLWGIKVRSPTYLTQQVYLTLSRNYDRVLHFSDAIVILCRRPGSIRIDANVHG
jgi:hypothetical protein